MIDRGRIPEGTDLAEIKNLCASYPYCSTFRLLLALGSKETDDLALPEAINLASVFVQDRSKLYEFAVRDGLRKRLEQEETAQPAEEATALEKATEVAQDGKRENRAEEAVINTDLLEEQIMAEAVVHLGEMEMEAQLNSPSDGDEEEKEKPERKVERGEGSFGSWLLKLDQRDEKKAERELIDRFVSEDRKITPAKKAFFSPSQMGKMSLMEDETFVTETLAKIYEKQGDYKKAARAYKNLSLKYPEKSAYFAALQKKAEEKI